MNIFTSIWRCFYWRFIKRVPSLPYTPQLVGARPLENGRLALAFWDKKSETEEVRIYDLWKGFASRKEDSGIFQWFDPVFFRTAYLYHQDVCWGEGAGLEMPAENLYRWSVLVEGDFQCLK